MDLSIEKIENISGTKSHTRLVFIINEKFVLKLSSPLVHFLDEIHIYEELNEFQNTHPEITDKIVKIHGFEKVKDFNKNKFSFTIQSGNFIVAPEKNHEVYKIISEFLDKIVKEYNVSIFLYAITEYNKKFDKLSDLNFFLGPKNYGDIVMEVMKTLAYLNDQLGFIHFDLWSDNLLVNIRKNEFAIKFYDFDKSSTYKNQNFYLLEVSLEEKFTEKFDYTNPNFCWTGLFYDIFRLVQNLCKQPEVNNLELNEFLEFIYDFDFGEIDIVKYQYELFSYVKNSIENNEKVTKNKTFKELVGELFPDFIGKKHLNQC